MKKMTLFRGEIKNWDDWGRIFQSISSFTPIVEEILKRENLPFATIENLTPGTNAVFKVGDYVVKIFAPAESGMDQTIDLQTELFAIRHVEKIGVSTPRMIAHGFVDDKYRFAYIITEYVNGSLFETVLGRDFLNQQGTVGDEPASANAGRGSTGVGDNSLTDASGMFVTGGMSAAEKLAFGRKLRAITDKMNLPCEPFNGIDVIKDKSRHFRWNKYPEQFKTERLSYINSHDYGERVFVHGDLCADNILLSEAGDIFIIDFADAVIAPIVYEHGHVAAELFKFDSALLKGFFGDYTSEELTEICFNGLLIHDFGGDIVEQWVGNPKEIKRLEDLREKLEQEIHLSLA